MIRTLMGALAVTVLVASSVPAAGPAREIDWSGLLPPTLIELEKESRRLGSYLRALPPGEQEVYREVAAELIAFDKLATGAATEDQLLLQERQALKERPSRRYPEAFDYWSRVKKVREALAAQSSAVDPALDGAQIRIPGYVLPLEFEGTWVKEFLLVPYVGACIHVPPPPPNQMVFVTARASFEAEGLFAPVWVEGTLSTRGGAYDLTLVDGTASVDAGYALEAAEVEPYR